MRRHMSVAITSDRVNSMGPSMEIHAPNEPIRSIRDFLYHMLTVVLGILIALSLESLVQWFEHRAVAREIRASLASEIRDNRNRLSTGLQLAPSAEKRLQDVVQRIHGTRAGTANFDLSFGLLPLSSANWTSAQSSGALQYLEESELQRYTRAYTVQQSFLSLQD
jgi:hypothetical protein